MDILFPLRRIHGCLHDSLIEHKRKLAIKRFKNLHLGERCFIVGNGPSLRVEDLEKLKNEICFGSHRIYHIYDKTEWRPFYYCAQDQELIKISNDEINEKIGMTSKFIGYVNPMLPSGIENDVKIQLILDEFYPTLPGFSQDLTIGAYEGYTVTYMAIQIAVYMGFKEIILLGIDHTYSISVGEDGKIIRNDKIKDHFSNSDTITNVPQTYKSTLAYAAAQKYAQSHGIRILNATRGGALEVFERVDFDTL